MKTIIICVATFTISIVSWAQQNPTIGGNQGQGSPEFWSRSGNNGGTNNLFGTKFNSPIYPLRWICNPAEYLLL